MLTGILSLHGATANMMRDPGWRMISAGQAVERGLQLCHLLRSTTTVRRGIDVDRELHNAVLTAAESAVTHRRRYRGYVRLAGVLDLLLMDADNPRSLAFGISELREHLAFLGAYLASMLAGVLSHVPAGLGVLESMLLLLLPDVPPEQLLAAVLMYRAIYEIIPVLLALALWGTFEGFSRDGVLLRVFGRQERAMRAASPTIDRSE